MASSENSRDWRISVILLVIWFVAVYLLWQGRGDIPFSMLALATIFFVLLVPTMNDLVRSIERYALGRHADTERDHTTR